MIGSKDSYALVTGASSGMGYEYAKLFAKDGKRIVVLARSRDKLEGLKKDLEKQHGTKVVVLVKDLSDPKAPQEVFSELEKAGINIDVLVNNAGFSVYGKFYDSDWQKEAEMIQVAGFIADAVAHIGQEDKLAAIKLQVNEMMKKFPLYAKP